MDGEEERGSDIGGCTRCKNSWNNDCRRPGGRKCPKRLQLYPLVTTAIFSRKTGIRARNSQHLRVLRQVSSPLCVPPRDPPPIKRHTQTSTQLPRQRGQASASQVIRFHSGSNRTVRRGLAKSPAVEAFGGGGGAQAGSVLQLPHCKRHISGISRDARRTGKIMDRPWG